MNLNPDQHRRRDRRRRVRNEPDSDSKSHSPPRRSEDTRGRLLEAAAKIFAEQGYRNATVQEICRRAGANIAAVNYHFGDKERLYSAVVDHAERYTLSEFPPTPESERGLDAEGRLRNHVREFLFRILDEDRSGWLGKLIAREMVEPTSILDKLVREKFRPNHERLTAIVGELLGPAATPENVNRCALSIRGQCLFYHLCQPAITRVIPGIRFDRGEIEQLAEFISDFSLAAIRDLAFTLPNGGRRRS
jgi:AcrR family transcriptional regulator